jgi:cell wall-associated NlpC family hydrolase
LNSCKSARSGRIVTKKSKTETKSYKPSLANTVVTNAIAFEGVRYKYGGTTKRGMDCSGLIYTAFREEDILLPRISRDMAKSGSKINLNQVEKGDLIFFKTSKSRNVINHVGLVTSITNGDIKFIHATSSKGVLTSSLSQHYWKSAFVEARRIL